MGSDFFTFKQFQIVQRRSAMKVGTDGVLIGAWARVRGDERRILDIGTGTGLIALMMAQRCPKALIDAVEIEPGAAQEARENVATSPWANRVTIYHEAFQTFATRRAESLEPTIGAKYDLIVSNPPYFDGTYKSTQAERTAARHVELMGSDDIIEGVITILEGSGRFCAIFPYQTGAVFIAKAASRGLYCNRILEIYPKVGRYVKRIAAEFSFERGTDEAEALYIEEGGEGGYTEAYRTLTRDFYLRF